MIAICLIILTLSAFSNCKTIRENYAENNRDFKTYLDENSMNKLNIFNSWHTNKLDYTKTDIDLTCKNTRDAFTVSVRNGNGVLTYPTALLTSEEIGLVNNFLKEEVFYTMTPYSYDTNSNNNGNYIATRTATSTDPTFLGMNSTTWIWLILAIAAVAIIALVYYYTNSISNTQNYNDNNE